MKMSEMEKSRLRLMYSERGANSSMKMWDRIIESVKDDKISLIVRREGNLVVMTEERYRELLGGKKDEEDNI